MPRKKEWVVEITSNRCPYRRKKLGWCEFDFTVNGTIKKLALCGFKNCPISVENLRKKREAFKKICEVEK